MFCVFACLYYTNEHVEKKLSSCHPCSIYAVREFCAFFGLLLILFYMRILSRNLACISQAMLSLAV
jgi:hypothetical protein